ncbi:hypothetical protein [Herbaspirillum robiniae]|uniref:Uncharacterized protein n=1 Tax=Herbaspirillum robiniae TaxID=2014887 RepID=A0ABX2M8L4_9BURK|nr:hypothetical protein [Herbaspirillum robiniae]NUU04587.1 hypothetical protein [Herbaspirillum robiniae]
MRKMASSVFHRGYEIRVRCVEEEYHWTVVELVVIGGGVATSASEFNLRPHYVSGEAALENGQVEGRRIIDEKLGAPSN